MLSPRSFWMPVSLALALLVTGTASGCRPHTAPAPRIVTPDANRVGQPWSPQDVNPAGPAVPSLMIVMTAHSAEQVYYWPAARTAPVPPTDNGAARSQSSIQMLTASYEAAPGSDGQYTSDFGLRPGAQLVSVAMRGG